MATNRTISFGIVAIAVAVTTQSCTTQAQTGAAPAVAAAPAAAASYDRPGFATRLYKERLWVFAEGSKELAEFDAEKKIPARHVVRPLAGPDRLTVCSPESDLLVGYLTYRPGFATRVHKERLWVFAEGSKELAEFDAEKKIPAKHVVRPLAGPMGMTIMAVDAATLDAYLAK